MYNYLKPIAINNANREIFAVYVVDGALTDSTVSSDLMVRLPSFGLDYG